MSKRRERREPATSVESSRRGAGTGTEPEAGATGGARERGSRPSESKTRVIGIANPPRKTLFAARRR